ncbi:MAG: hypothetical protein U1E78_12775 [Gammaproteobacteria bacterium]
MLKASLLLSIVFLVCGCQTPYTNWHSYRNKSADYKDSKLIAPLNVADTGDIKEETYPIPPETLRGSSPKIDLWPPSFPKES